MLTATFFKIEEFLKEKNRNLILQLVNILKVEEIFCFKKVTVLLFFRQE